MMDDKEMLNHRNTHIFTPIASKLFERASQLVHVKVRGFVPSLTLSARFPRIRRFRIVMGGVWVIMCARFIIT